MMTLEGVGDGRTDGWTDGSMAFIFNSVLAIPDGKVFAKFGEERIIFT